MLIENLPFLHKSGFVCMICKVILIKIGLRHSKKGGKKSNNTFTSECLLLEEK